MTQRIQVGIHGEGGAQIFVGSAAADGLCFSVVVCRSLSARVECTIPPAEGTWENTGERMLPVARPRYQKGYVRLRGQNWEVRFREDYLDGERRLRRRHRSVVLGSFRTKKEAQRAADAYLRPLNQGACRPRMDITLADFWSRYYQPEILPTLKVSTQKLYLSLFQVHLLPALGTRKLAEIQRLEVQRFVTLKQSAGYSPQTLAHFRNFLSALYSTALSWGMVSENPASGINLPVMERRREVRVLSAEEIQALLHTLPEPSRTIVLLGVATGLRIGEMLALRVMDVDLAGGLLFVRRAIYRGVMGSPKTKRGERRVPLASFVVRALESFLASRRVDSDLFFSSRAGTPLHDRNLFRRQVEPVLAKLGIRHFGWHSLRHTFRTIAGNRGVPVEVVQSVLGHTSMDTTMLYMHRDKEAERQAAEKVAEVLCPNVPKTEGLLRKGKTLIQ